MKPVGDDMSISITDPPANQVVGSFFTVIGTFYCPVGGPTILCSISPTSAGGGQRPVPAKIQALYLTNTGSTWGSYFTGLTAGNYTVNASIAHTGSQVNAAPVNISVSATPPVTITSPKEGDTFPVGTITVNGTVGSDYLSGYNVVCSLTGAGFVAGGPITATPDQSGNWSATLPVPQGVSGYNRMNVNANLVNTNTNACVCEIAVGSLTVQ